MAPKAVLVGLPGSGKSTIGRRLAKALGVGLLDTDVAIEQRTGRSIADIFATDGEQEFRRIEEDVVRAALADHDGVLSLGGGAVTSPGVRAALAGHRRLPGDQRRRGRAPHRRQHRAPTAGRPRPRRKYRALMAKRAPLYRRVATMRVDTNRRNPGAVVRHILSRLQVPSPSEAAT